MIFFVCCILGLCAFSLGAGGVLFKEQFVRKQYKDSLEPHSLKNALDTLESPSSEKTSQSKGDLKGTQSSTKFDKVATHVQDKKIMIPLLREKLQWMEEQKNGLYKEISVLGKKNVLLKGYFRDTGSNVVGILVHGYLDSAAGLGYLAKEYVNLGFSVLSVDCRGHGFSGGKYITMGYTDAYDVSLWIKEIVKRKGPSVKIILHGVSMGAATVIESLGLQSTEGYAAHISGVIADCSFASAKKQLLKEGRRLLGNSLFARCTLRVIYWGMSFICFVSCGFFYGQSSPEKTLKERQNMGTKDIPVVIFHGEKDTLVEPATADILKDAAGKSNVRVFKIKDAPHIGSYFYGKEEYINQIKDLV